VEWATAAGAPTSKWQTLRQNPSGANTGIVVIERPYTTALTYVRAKSIKLGYADSAYSTVASQRPAPLVDVLPHAGLEGRRIAEFNALRTALSKTVRIPYSESLPNLTTHKWIFGVSEAFPNTTALTQGLVVPITLPQGVTLTKVVARMLRLRTASTASFSLKRYSATGGAVELSAKNATTSLSYQDVASSVMTEVVTSTKCYTLHVNLRTTGIGSVNRSAAFRHVDVTYTMPSLDKAR
jgi:hypothetical protein